jgi:hypothetical protein
VSFPTIRGVDGLADDKLISFLMTSHLICPAL